MATDQLTTKLNELVDKYKRVITTCYDALSADTPQETRDAVRESIKSYVEETGVEE